jgi:predicted MPP superfamily phosphohydrolase
VLKDDINKIISGKVEKEWETPTLRKKLKIMHISDLHVDIFYTSGAESKCNEPVCCRVNSANASSVNQIISDQAQGKYL